MQKRKKKVELPIVEPVYSTYHYQGPGSAVLAANPSVRNFYLNQATVLTCNRKFLNGYTTPEISVSDSSWYSNFYLDKKWYGMQFLKGGYHYVIRNLLDAGYYVCFSEVDDYYVEGKTWYRERHFSHDGCICGYDTENKTYCIYAYDRNWIYRKFTTPQKAFHAGIKTQFRKKQYGSLCGIKPKDDAVAFSSETALGKIAEYLDSDMKKYPADAEGDVSGIVVHDYIAMYVKKLCDGSIPYERTDRRVFRMIWEHKKAMLERIGLIETEMQLGNSISEAYKAIVREADNCRMLYAAHYMKQRYSALSIILNRLPALKIREQEILNELINKTKGEKKT